MIVMLCGIARLVMELASMQVNRRARRVKTDRIDVASVLHALPYLAQEPFFSFDVRLNLARNRNMIILEISGMDGGKNG